MISQKKSASILVCATDLAHVEDTCQILGMHDHQVVIQILENPLPENVQPFHLAIIDTSDHFDTSLKLCRELRLRATEGYLPTLLLTKDHSPTTRLAAFAAGADTCLSRPFAPEELLVQVQALLRIKEVHDRLAEKTAEVHRMNKRLQQAYQQIDHELELAKRIQSSFVPQHLPEVPSIRFAVRSLLCNQLGGDFYDVFRLDEKHVGFYVADAMGRGVPASLLTLFVKNGVQPKEIIGNRYRLVPPEEVLQKLNRDLIDQQLDDHPFITLVYVLFNHEEGTLQFSRAGHPYPLYVPREGEVQFWEQQGMLLGIFEAQFNNRREQLHRGDKVILFSDGIDEARFEDYESGTESLLACVTRHRHLGLEEMIHQVAQDLFGSKAPSDDLTLLGVETQ